MRGEEGREGGEGRGPAGGGQCVSLAATRPQTFWHAVQRVRLQGEGGRVGGSGIGAREDEGGEGGRGRLRREGGDD